MNSIVFVHASVLILVVASSLPADTESTIYLFVPTDETYPEYNIKGIAEQGKKVFEKQYPNIKIKIEILESDAGNIVSDSKITRLIVENKHSGSLDGCIGMLHSREALEMATFFEIPTITYSSVEFLDYGYQVAINPRYENTTKAIFRVLKQFNWTRVNFIVSTLPWYKDIGSYFYSKLTIFNSDTYQQDLKAENNGFNFKIEGLKEETIKFTLDSHNKDRDYFVRLLNKTKTANILLFIGHQCEFKRLIVTAYQEGYLEPGKIVLYIDSFGQMSDYLETDCTSFAGWSDYQRNESALNESMNYVIYGVAHWEDMRTTSLSRKEFEAVYNVTSYDNRAFDMLLIDSLAILTSFIDNSKQSNNTNSNLMEYAKTWPGKCMRTDNCLYSGREGFDDKNRRALPIGMKFYHGNGSICIMGWDDCTEIYCKEITDPGNKINWAGGIKPTSIVKAEEDSGDVAIILGPILAALLLTTGIAFMTTRFYKIYKAKSSIKIWGLDRHDFNFSNNEDLYTGDHDGMFPKSYNNVTRIRGKYKNFDVFIKEVSGFKSKIIDNYDLSLDILIQKDIEHENINPLIGIRMMNHDIQIVSPYCSKGSLMEVLKNNPMNINDNVEYKLHILRNIADGMAYLHNASNMFHGNLKSTNCLVDSRWVVKITDFEPDGIRCAFEEDCTRMEHHYAQKLWTAPELQSEKQLSKKKMKMCDVYSFAIICFEVLANTLPYHEDNQCQHSYSEIIKRVKECSEPPFRPLLKRCDCNGNEEIYNLVKRCWEQRPTLRHSFNWISKQLENISSGEDFGDFIATQMEKYSSGLDQMIEEMEASLKKEKKDYEDVLQDMLPRQIAASIKAGRQPPFETSEVSLYFSDILNFSKISALRDFKDNPKLIVEFLNMVYGILDKIVECFETKLYKVETINDSYLVMSGLPVRQDKDHMHAGLVANFALHVLSRVNEIEIDGHPDLKVQIRIGIHSGQVAAGVIGKLNPRYCLFGDTVNFTSRLESTGKPFTIHTSEKTVALLKETGDLFRLIPRAEKVTLKNRGEHQTYFLVGMEGFEWELPKATRLMDKFGDVSDTTSVSSERSRTTSNNRKISACSTNTEYSCTDTGISSAFVGSSNRSKKLSSSIIQMQESIMLKCGMLLMDKMKKPVNDTLDICEQERPCRRAFSEPNSGNFTDMDELRKVQRMSTPFRKESESLYQRGEEGVPEPLTEPLDSDIDSDIFTEDGDTKSDSLDLENLGEMDLANVYNHEQEMRLSVQMGQGRVSSDSSYCPSSLSPGLTVSVDSVESVSSDRSPSLQSDDDPLVTPTDSASKDPLKRRTTITNQPRLSPPGVVQLTQGHSESLEYLSGVTMGVKRYSFKRTSESAIDDQE